MSTVLATFLRRTQINQSKIKSDCTLKPTQHELVVPANPFFGSNCNLLHGLEAVISGPLVCLPCRALAYLFSSYLTTQMSFRLDENVCQNSLTPLGEKNSLTPQGSKNLNYRRTCDQVLHLETAANLCYYFAINSY